LNTPLVWIVFPIILGIVLIFFQRWKTGILIAGTSTALLLAVGAWLLPIEEVIALGPWSITLEKGFSLGGLQFVLERTDRPLLAMLYVGTAFLLCGSLAAQTQSRIIPLGLILVATIIGALAVIPILYGALFLNLAILICALILSPPGHEASKGVLRYLVFQILGLAFILLAGWLLPESGQLQETTPGVMNASLILGIGFIFLFAVFPLYTWVTMIAEDSHPYAAVFVFSMTFGANTLYFLSFLESNPWLLGMVNFFGIIRVVGVIMVATGGLWAAFQRDLGRLLGYAVVIEVGQALLSIGIQNGDLHYAMLVPRILSLSVWGLGLSAIKLNAGKLSFREVQGMARRLPVACTAVLMAHFSIAGLPFLAGFPVLLTLWEQLANFSVSQVTWSFLGSIGLMAGGFRSLAVLVMGPEDLPSSGRENVLQQIFLIIGMVGLLVFGLFPQWVYPIVARLAGSFMFLSP